MGITPDGKPPFQRGSGSFILLGLAPFGRLPRTRKYPGRIWVKFTFCVYIKTRP
jgi:hypothetical protein